MAPSPEFQRKQSLGPSECTSVCLGTESAGKQRGWDRKESALLNWPLLGSTCPCSPHVVHLILKGCCVTAVSHNTWLVVGGGEIYLLASAYTVGQRLIPRGISFPTLWGCTHVSPQRSCSITHTGINSGKSQGRGRMHTDLFTPEVVAVQPKAPHMSWDRLRWRMTVWLIC